VCHTHNHSAYVMGRSERSRRKWLCCPTLRIRKDNHSPPTFPHGRYVLQVGFVCGPNFTASAVRALS
jgi:hypothetical protein